MLRRLFLFDAIYTFAIPVGDMYREHEILVENFGISLKLLDRRWIYDLTCTLDDLIECN